MPAGDSKKRNPRASRAGDCPQNPDNTEIWGFNQDPAINTYVNYNNGEFYYDRLISLSEPEQQFLLLLRYFDCVTRGALTDSSLLTFSPSSGQHWSNSAPIEYINNYPIGINYYFLYLLSDLLGGPNLGPLIGFTGSIYCLDNLNMSVTYQFTTGDFPPNLMEAITLLDLWPRPAGVAISFQTL